MPLTPRDADKLVDDAAPRIRNSFIGAILGVTEDVNLGRLESAIRAADWDGAWLVIDMSEADFNEFREAERGAFRSGGEAEARANGWKFDMGAAGAAADESRRIGPLIREITDETRDMVRDRVRQAIAGGENPRSAALDIVGRRTPGTHRRTGGMIGLTRTQEEWAQNARDELSDPATARRYLDRQARDRRFDASARRAVREGRPVPASVRQKMIDSYRSRLLRLRGEAIGRTEALGAVNAGRHESVQQAIQDPNTEVTAQEIRRTWIATRDGRVRDTHAAMGGQVRGHDQPFDSPSGARLMYPGDRSLGAPAAELIFCRCTQVYTLT